MAREIYDFQLNELKNEMLHLGSMIEEVIRISVKALVTQDIKQAKQIIAGDDKVDEQVRRIEQKGYALLLRQQPVAGDLRAVSAALKMLTDMERIGDHGADISELTILMSCETYPVEIKLIEEMAKETTIMLTDAVDAFAGENKEKANAVIARDDRVDELFLETKNVIADTVMKKQESAMLALDLLMVAKYFERIGDHATNIAEWVLFFLTGELPKN